MTATRATTVSSVGLPESSHAYSSWRARARALVSGRCTEPLERRGGLEGRLHRLGTFTDARQRLSLGLRRQNAKPDRDAVRERDVPETALLLTRDILEMRSLTADHAPERHDRVEAFARRGGLGQNRQLKGTGRPCDFHVVIRDAAAPQRVARALEQLRRDVLMKPADNDRHAPLAVGGARRGGRRSLVRHDQRGRKWP